MRNGEGTQVKINRRASWAVAALLVAGVIAACNRGSDDSVAGPSSSDVPQTQAAPPRTPVAASSSDVWISEEDRKWWKQHVPHFGASGTVITVSGTNPWDHPIHQGHARQLWLKVFDKTTVPQGFIGQAGPFTIGAKDSFSAALDIGYGYCFVEAELRIDSADNHQNGGDPHMLFGAANLDVAECKKPKTPRGPECRILPIPPPTDGVGASTIDETPLCDLCDNIEGNQQEIPIDEATGLPYTRVFDEETGQFLCTKTSTGCVDEETGEPIPCPEDVCPNLEGTQETVPEGYHKDEAGDCVPNCVEVWIPQEPIVTYGEFGACAPVLNSSSGNHEPSCSKSRLVTVVINEINSCTQEVREKSRETRTDTQSCECPCTATTSYWKMNQGSENARENACENRGGEWLNSSNIPGDNNSCLAGGVAQVEFTLFGNKFCKDVCRFQPNPPGNPGGDITLYDPPGIVSDCEDD